MSTKTGIERQNAVLANFNRTLNSEKYRTEPTQIERMIAESEKSRKAWESKKKPAEQPRISFYNPNNPLNGFRSKTKAEQVEITKQIKASVRAAKKAAANSEVE